MSLAQSTQEVRAPERKESDVIQSASITAMMRSVLASESGKLKNPDYLATHFVNDEWRNYLQDPKKSFEMLNHRIPGGVIYMLIRTKYFDDSLRKWLKKNPDSQIVLMGSGFDTRSLRFDNSLSEASTFFELDLKRMLEHKKQIINNNNLNSNNIDIRYLPINFHEEDSIDVLLENGLNPNKPTYFLLESISFFLEEKTIINLLSKINESMQSETLIALDYVFRDYVEGNLSYYGAKETHAELQDLGEPHLFGLNYNEVEAFFNNVGYEVKNNYTSKMLEFGYLANQDGSNSLGSISTFFGLTEAGKY